MKQVIPTPEYLVHVRLGCAKELPVFLNEIEADRIFFLTDENTFSHCLPFIHDLFPEAINITIPAGEENKSLETCTRIWTSLTESKAGRDSCLINLGGGMVGDLGGFAAACYKRGIRFVQIPTTLLAMVDASVGGKTGINFAGFKNQIGTFQNPAAVFVDPLFLKTLPRRELASGMAEMLKHGLISDAGHWEYVSNRGLEAAMDPSVIARSIELKAQIVAADPFEHGIRAALNFGHTLGHALESASFSGENERLFHGEAVAAGMLCEAFLSHRIAGLDADSLRQIQVKIRQHFPDVKVPDLRKGGWQDYLFQDKKNKAGQTRFSLIEEIGRVQIHVQVPASVIEESLEYLNNTE